jgi:hypothetical protein
MAGFEKESELAPLGFESEDDMNSIGLLKKDIVSLITSMLEGESDQTILTRMAASIDFVQLKARMVTVFLRFAGELLPRPAGYFKRVKNIPMGELDAALKPESFDDFVGEVFEIYNLISTLADGRVPDALGHIAKETLGEDQLGVFEYIRAHTGRIEVSVSNQLQRIYFPIPPVCRYLAAGSRQRLMTNVTRESHTTKIKGLIDAVPDLLDEMELSESLEADLIAIRPERLAALKGFSSLVGVAMNLEFLLFARRKFHYREPDIYDWVIDSIELMGWLQGTTSLILIFFFIINKKQIICKKGWRDFVAVNQDKYEPIVNEDQLAIGEMSIEMTHMILLLEGPEAPAFNMGDELDLGNFYTKAECFLLNFYFFI